MKLVSFMADGRAGIGRVEGRNVIDLTEEVEGATDLSELLAVSCWAEKAAKAGRHMRWKTSGIFLSTRAAP